MCPRVYGVRVVRLGVRVSSKAEVWGLDGSDLRDFSVSMLFRAFSSPRVHVPQFCCRCFGPKVSV